LIADDDGHVCDTGVAAALLAVAEAVVDAIELHDGLVRRLAKLLERDVLHLNLNLVRRAGQETPDGAFALIVGDRGLGERGFQEVQRLGVLRLHGGAHAAVVLGHELDEEVLQFRRLAGWAVRERIVRDRLGAANFVDADHEHTLIHRDCPLGVLRQDLSNDFTGRCRSCSALTRVLVRLLPGM
jgi:hypothetical protein